MSDSANGPLPVRFGLCADVHKDIMHDAAARLGGFVEAMQRADPAGTGACAFLS